MEADERRASCCFRKRVNKRCVHSTRHGFRASFTGWEEDGENRPRQVRDPMVMVYDDLVVVARRLPTSGTPVSIWFDTSFVSPEQEFQLRSIIPTPAAAPLTAFNTAA